MASSFQGIDRFDACVRARKGRGLEGRRACNVLAVGNAGGKGGRGEEGVIPRNPSSTLRQVE